MVPRYFLFVLYPLQPKLACYLTVLDDYWRFDINQGDNNEHARLMAQSIRLLRDGIGITRPANQSFCWAADDSVVLNKVLSR